MSEIIQVLNDRFGTNFTEKDRLFMMQIRETALNNEQVIKTAIANPNEDKFRLGLSKYISDFMIDCMTGNDAIVTRYMEDQQFKSAVLSMLSKDIHATVRDISTR